MGKTKGLIRTVVGKPGSGKATTTFTSGATTTDLMCGQFFMKMQDEGKSLAEIRAYANIGPMLMPNMDWLEVHRVLNTFGDKP